MTNAIIAVNPQQMAEAQSTTIRWIDAKIEAAKAEIAHADSVRVTLATYGLRVESAAALLNKSSLRLRFYEKVKAALDAGYYLVPPFPLQLFAVRTDQAAPKDASTRGWTRDFQGRSLPVGVGHYVNPDVPRLRDGEKLEKNADGTTREVQMFRNGDFRDEIDMPWRAMQPEVIEATGRALELKIFDALGIMPSYRAADPIICGQIRRPVTRTALTFFVAWWLDERDL